jgi:glycosyltransferase involved in cell wall biosynthesis
MKKVLIVITSFRHGGTNKSLQNILSLIEKKYDIYVFALDHYGPYKNMFENCTILKKNKYIEFIIAKYGDLNGISKFYSLMFKSLHRLFRLFNINILDIFFRLASKNMMPNKYDISIAFGEGLPTRFVLFINCPKKIAWIHCDYDSYLKLNNHPNEKEIYKDYNYIVCGSKFTGFQFIRHMPSLKNKVVIINNPINIDMIIKASNDKISESYFNDSNYFKIISVGRIDHVKRFIKIPKVARKLKDKGCKFKWYLIGPQDQKGEIERLKKNIIKYSVSDCFYWLGPKNNPYPYIKQSNLLVHTSKTESCPLILIEAMILGTPVICTEFGSAHEFINDGSNGFVVSLEGLVDEIYSIISNNDKYKKLKENLRHYSYDYRSIMNYIYRLLD